VPKFIYKKTIHDIQTNDAKGKCKADTKQKLTRQYVSTSINTAVIIVVISKQPSVMPLLHHYKSYWRLVIGLQGCTSLHRKFRKRDSQGKKETDIIG
jgi:hypothetical protein